MSDIHFGIVLHLVANEQIQGDAARDAQCSQQLLGALLDEMPVAADDAARDIVGADLEFALEALGGLHLGLAEESKAARVSPVLLEHVETGAVGLILNNDQRLVQGNEFVVLVDEHILVGQPDVALSFKEGVLGIAVDDFGTVDHLLIAPATGIIETLQCRRVHPLGEPGPYNFSVLGGIESDEPGILVAATMIPAIKDFLDGIVRHKVVAVDTGVEQCVDIAVGGVVGAMHSLVLLIDVTDGNFALGNPSLDQLAGIVGRTVIND